MTSWKKSGKSKQKEKTGLKFNIRRLIKALQRGIVYQPDLSVKTVWLEEKSLSSNALQSLGNKLIYLHMYTVI